LDHHNGPCSAEENQARIARLAVGVSLMLWLATAAVLLFAAAPRQCPGWHLDDASSTSLWALWVVWGGLANAFGSFIVLRWDWATQKAIEAESDYHWLPIPAAYILVRMCLAACLAAQLPLFFLLTKCTPLVGPGG
jgi:hypothetical protein